MTVLNGWFDLLGTKEQQKTTRMNLPSPCISICQIHPETGNCLGCYRSRQEIAKWSAMSLVEQAELLKVLKQRRAEKTRLRPRQTRRLKKNSDA